MTVLKKPEVKEKKIDPRSWVIGSAVEDWRKVYLHHSHSIRHRCIVDVRSIEKASELVHQGRSI